MSDKKVAELSKKLFNKVTTTYIPKTFKALGGIKSTPMAVDVSANGMKQKSKALKGTGVTYSGIRTSSQGLLTGAKTEKKTLLGG